MNRATIACVHTLTWTHTTQHTGYQVYRLCAYLWIDEQRPAAGLADNDGIVDGAAVVGQALNDPVPDLHRLPQHCCHAELSGARDVVPLTL